MIISHRKKFIFIHNYKVAGTSISNALMPHAKNTKSVRLNKLIDKYTSYKSYKYYKGRNTHITALELKTLIGRKFDGYYKFGFVRNPYTWQISHYTFGRKNPKHPTHRLFCSFKNFDEYMIWRVNNVHKLQKDFFYDQNGNNLMDYIGKLENINRDIQHVQRAIGLKLELKKLNVTNSDKLIVEELISTQSIDLINELYDEDFKTFGYHKIQHKYPYKSK